MPNHDESKHLPYCSMQSTTYLPIPKPMQHLDDPYSSSKSMPILSLNIYLIGIFKYSNAISIPMALLSVSIYNLALINSILDRINGFLIYPIKSVALFMYYNDIRQQYYFCFLLTTPCSQSIGNLMVDFSQVLHIRIRHNGQQTFQNVAG